MSITVKFQDGPLSAPAQASVDAAAGAVLCFEGLVRPQEDGRPLIALDYEAYQPMATSVMEQLATQAVHDFGLLGTDVEHSVGRVPVGDCSFRLRVTSAHRREGIEALAWFIDTMKKDAPIWKKPVFLDDHTEAGEAG